MKINHSSRADQAERHAADAEAEPLDEHVAESAANSDGPDDGPTMSQAGAMPSGSEMTHWHTGMARPDSTNSSTMPETKSTPMPGEKNHKSRNAV